MISYSTDGVKMPPIKRRETTAWIKAVAAKYGRKTGEIGYMFVNDERILEVNREYLGHDYYTDIITFDYDEGDVINGDIVISLDTVRTNAEQYGKEYIDELQVTAFNYYAENKKELAVTFGALAMLFQPFIKIALGRAIWNIVDVAVAILLLVLTFTKKEKE